MSLRAISLFIVLFITALGINGAGQSSGSIRGQVILEEKGTPLHNVIIVIPQLNRSVETDDQGNYQVTNLLPGTYSVHAHMEGFPDVAQSVRVVAGDVTTADFRLRITGLHEQVTVTASGKEQSTFESFQATTTLDSIRLTEEAHTSIGEVLEHEPGVAKRSFGPGSSRPVIRGFDGDRVLILQDGMRVGSLGSQSADHGEPVDVLNSERVEIVKGPATLLYGSNALGGVVNVISGREEHFHEGIRGFLTGIGGTTNDQAAFSSGVEYGLGKWMLWGQGTGQRTADYSTPAGRIVNSDSRQGSGSTGFGWFDDKGFFSLSYGFDGRRYGVPFASEFHGHAEEEEVEAEEEHTDEMVDLRLRRHNLRFNGGLTDLGSFVNGLRFSLDYTDYRHDELEGEEIGTVYNNNQYHYRALFDQKMYGRLTGRFGFEGTHREYETIGPESLSPPVDHNSFSVFALEELGFKRVAFQLGGRVEHNRYSPVGLLKRSFTGVSGSAGMRVGLYDGGAFVANYTHAHRAPALEELYNNGPHIGTLTFEIGNPNLTRERSDGMDLSFRHLTDRFRIETNFFYYDIKDFVYLAPTGEIEDGLPVAEYSQDDSRFMGSELNVDMAIAPKFLWLNTGLDYVDAELKSSGLSLPRIPPLRARIGLDARYKGLSIRPEVIMVKDQDQVFLNETRTAGYAVFNVTGSYTIAREHAAHIFSVNAFNLGDRLYRNHLSFIKELAPEIGRGFRAAYTVRFF
jgi:iron complex outermembrane recepter protein